MTTNVKKVLHAGISVYNMEESLAWYKKNLGFEVVKNDGYVPPLKAGFVENGVDIAHEVRMDGEAVMFVRDCNGVLLEFIQGK